MTPDATTSPAPQAAAPGSQPAPASPAPQPTPVQLLWEVATLAFELMRRLVNVLQPIQQYYPKPALLLARLLIDIPRIFLTIRYAPERVTMAQLRHLTRARHILQALFNYTLPLGPQTSSSATTTANQSPSATPLGPRTSSSATANVNQHPTPSPNSPSSTTPGVRTPTIREVPGIPMVAGVSHVPAPPTVNNSQFPPSPTSHDSHTSYPSHSSQSLHSAFPNPQSAIHNPQSPVSPYIPDFHTLAQALKADSLPPNCAGALFEDPGDALVKALHQLHAIYFSLYPTQSPSPVQSPSPSQSPSQSPSNGNLQSITPQSAIHNPQSDVHSVHSPSHAQPEIPNPHASSLNSASPIPYSSVPIRAPD